MTVVLDYNTCKTLYDVTSDQAFRPVFHYARIAQGRGEATNGHIMLRVPLVDWPEDHVGEWFLHRDALAMVKSGGQLTLDLVTGKTQLANRKGTTVDLPDAQTSPAGGVWPDIERVIPKDYEGEGVRFALSGTYIRVLSDLAKRQGKNARVILHVNDPGRGLLVEVPGRHGPTVTGVLMPVGLAAEK